MRSDKWMVDIGINTKRQEILEEIGELNRRFNTSKYENKMKIKTEKDRKERKEYIDKYNRELKTLFTKLDKLNPSSLW